MDAALVEIRRSDGRLILAEPPGTLWAGRRYDIARSDDDGATWQRVTSLPRTPARRFVERSRLACRLLRHEVRALVRTSEGTLVAATRQGVFHARPGDPVMRASRVEAGALPLLPPMRLGAGPGDVVLFGEYGAGRNRPIRLFASDDGGRTFRPVATLEAGSVVHVHNVLYDPHLRHYWVLAGDHDHEPGFGMLSADLQRFEWFVRGEQRFRAVVVFDFVDRLVYATDTEVETNGLISLDKQTGKAERLRDFEGSCIYACRYGGLLALTTTVEPSPVNRCDHAGLWLSRDGERWVQAYRARKDVWNPDYFQFGSLVLPAGYTEREIVAWSGQAVRGIDGTTVFGRLADAGLAGPARDPEAG